MNQSRWEVAVIALSIGLTLLLSIRNPLFEPPDERLHYRYVRHLLTERTLPVQEIDGEPSHSHHPPLYYLIGALLVSGIEDDQTESEVNPFWTSYRRDEVHRDNKNLYIPNAAHNFPWHGTALVMHVLRAYSVVLFAGTLVLVRRIGRFLWPNNPAKRLLMLTFVAFNPMMIYISSAVNNDNLLILLGSAILLLSLHGLSSEEKQPANDHLSLALTILIGVLWGLSLLTKLNGLVLAAVWGSVLLWLFFKRRSPLFAIGRGLIITVVSVPLFAWWFLRNIRVYGDILGMEVHCAVWGCRTDEQFNIQHFLGNARYVWSNYWGRFGYGQINLPDVIYAALAIMTLLAITGAFVQLYRYRQMSGQWFVLAVSALMFMLAMLYYLVRVPVGANARYVFPVSAAIAALLTQGLFVLPKMRDLSRGIGLMLALLAVWATAWFVPWTYAAPSGTTSMAMSEQVVQVDPLCWQQAICLLGYTLEVDDVDVWFNGCWVARESVTEDFIFFVHLLDFDFNPLGARDSYTGRGNFPTSFWRVGEQFCDRFAVPISADTSISPVAQAEIGMYRVDGERVSAEYDSGHAPDPIIIETIRLTDEPIATSMHDVERYSAEFQQGVELIGYRWVSETDQQLTLQSYWRATETPQQNYTIFAHVVDGDGEIITQADGPPLNNRFPMRLWQDGDVLLDERSFLIDDLDDVAQLWIGFYDPVSAQRLLRIDVAGMDSAEIPLPTR